MSTAQRTSRALFECHTTVTSGKHRSSARQEAECILSIPTLPASRLDLNIPRG